MGNWCVPILKCVRAPQLEREISCLWLRRMPEIDQVGKYSRTYVNKVVRNLGLGSCIESYMQLFRLRCWISYILLLLVVKVAPLGYYRNLGSNSTSKVSSSRLSNFKFISLCLYTCTWCACAASVYTFSTDKIFWNIVENNSSNMMNILFKEIRHF